MSQNAQKVKTICDLCPYQCGITVHVEDGKIVKATGLKEFLPSKGLICSKGTSLPEVVYDPKRIKYPQKKVNGDWKRISWDEALDAIAENLKANIEKYGPTSVSTFLGDQVILDFLGCSLINRFADVLGTPNRFGPGSICYDVRTLSQETSFGSPATLWPDFENAECTIIWGANPNDSNPPLAVRIQNYIKEKKPKLIVINPRRTYFAKKADIYAQVRPGTDAALLLGMIHVIVSENLYDKAFVDKWTVGFDQLAEHVKKFPPEEMEKICRVPAQTIRDIARIYATNRPSCVIQGGNGLDQHRSGFQSNRLMDILKGITAGIGKGGLVIVPFPVDMLSPFRVPELVKDVALGTPEYPLFAKGAVYGPLAHTLFLPDAVLNEKPYPIKTILVQGANPAITYPNSKKWREVLMKTDFLVVMEHVMTETAKLADMVLPVSTFLEKATLACYYAATHNIPYAGVRRKIVDFYECRSEREIWKDLAERLGYGDYFPWHSDEELIDYALKPTGLTAKLLLEEYPAGMSFGPLDLDVWQREGFHTPSGKIELYSEYLKELGYDPLPVHLESPESPLGDPELFKEYPIVATSGGRRVTKMGSQFDDLPGFQHRDPEPQMDIHPDTAKANGIHDGDKVLVESRRGSIKIKAKVTEDIGPGVVHIPHGWAMANVNLLTDDTRVEPICGYAALKSFLCKISKKE